MKKVETISIQQATEAIIDYRGKTPPKSSSGVRLITAKVVKGGQILDEPAEYIQSSYYDEWMRRGLPRRLTCLSQRRPRSARSPSSRRRLGLRLHNELFCFAQILNASIPFIFSMRCNLILARES